METTQTQPKNPYSEEIWAILQNLAKRQEETDREMKEEAKLLKERAEQFALEMREMKERAAHLDRQLGSLGNRFGEMVEYMVMPNLLEKFGMLGFVFEKAYRDASIKDAKNNVITEIDITLENGDKVMIVEIKSKPKTEDISEHIERMEKVRSYADSHNDKRKFLGAIGGMVFNDNEKKFALKNGFYVIEPSGEAFIITVPNGEFSPREW